MADAATHLTTAGTAGTTRRNTVAVIGGGIAGLSAAWELASSGADVDVVVLEAGDRLGGKLYTGTIGGRAVDLGPDAFLARRPEAVALCRQLGLDDELVSPGSRSAYVWARNELRPLPAGLALGVPTRLVPLARSGIVSSAGVANAARDLMRRHGKPDKPDNRDHPVADRAVADITRERLGHEITAQLVDPLIGGIHAGDTARMSTAAVFPSLLDAAGQGGSLMRALRPATAAATTTPGAPLPPVFHSVRGGLSRLVETLADALVARGVELRLTTPVESLELAPMPGDPAPDNNEKRWTLGTAAGPVHADAVVVATPAGAAASLLDSVDHTVAAMLGAIEYSDVTLVTMRFADTAVTRPLDGTGFLVPRVAGCLITACTWLTSKWSELQRPGDVLLRASMGRYGDDRPAQLSDDEIVRRVHADLEPMLGLRATPTETVVTRWPGAFPQYDVGHLDRVATLEQAVARLPALALAGAAYRGVGIPACIASGRQAATAVLGQMLEAGRTTT